MAKKPSFSAVILAAGLSGRMGTSKSFLSLEGKTFIENIVQGYQKSGAHEIVIVTNNKDKERCLRIFPPSVSGIVIAVNEHPEKGRFLSLKTGLSALKNTHLCFIHNVDNPFADDTIIKGMLQSVQAGTYSVPVFKNKKGHPILISNTLINDILSEPHDDLILKNFLEKYDCTFFKCHSKKILININTQGDYRRLLPVQ
ncbi:MAG: Nicotine blue oxidoreductase [Bacteroidetes bacterium ADurb.Bin408]|nr:MAG: Nicotine blue oxidoreductase [Bacteroidetes bacterium ADurb.Bin408]